MSNPVFALKPVVSDVQVLGAPSTVPLESRSGEPLDSTKVQHDIKTLWENGRASDVTAETVPDGPSVRLLFRVKTAAPPLELRKLKIDPPTAGIHPGVAPGMPIDPRTAQAVAAGIRKELEHSGFTDAVVIPRLVPAGQGKADLNLEINKGQSVDIAGVVVKGDLGIRPQDVRAALHATRAKRMIPGIPGIWNGWHLRPGFNAEAVDADAASLRSFYYQRGHFNASVRVDSVDQAAGKAQVAYWIQSGPRFAIREFRLPGDSGRTLTVSPSGEFPAQAVCRELFRERRDAERSGVADFNPTLNLVDAPAPSGNSADGRQWADAMLTVDRGPAYRVSRIEFRGVHSFSDEALRRSFLLEEGAPLDETLIRASLTKINRMGLFEPLTPASVVVNTPPDSDTAQVTVWLKEKKMRSWFLSGPVGPMSIAGPLQFALGTRLPSWGRGVLELSTYAVSLNLMLFAKPVSTVLPFLPQKRFLPLIVLQRPLLPGQRFLSGVTLAPQLGWQGMLAGYGMSQMRDVMGPLWQPEKFLQPDLPVAITVNGSPRGSMVCSVQKTKIDRVRQVGGMVTNLLFSFSPL